MCFVFSQRVSSAWQAELGAETLKASKPEQLECFTLQRSEVRRPDLSTHRDVRTSPAAGFDLLSKMFSHHKLPVIITSGPLIDKNYHMKSV